MTEAEIEAAARALADHYGLNWECCCTAERGPDCDCGDAILEERQDPYDEAPSREELREAARATLAAAEAVRKPADLTDRLSAASAGFLWCVHVVGPDDVYPVRSYAEAVVQAAKLNAATIEASEETGVAVVAVPAVWPHDSESHRAEIAKATEAEGR